jgi:hypothetical protein
MRKPAEALDDLDIRVPVATQGTAAIGIARLGVEQYLRAALVVDVLAVMKRHMEEPTPHRRKQLVEAAGERPVGGATCGRVGRVGARRAAEDVARDLVEQQHQGKSAFRQRLPRGQRPGGGRLVVGEEISAQRRVEIRCSRLDLARFSRPDRLAPNRIGKRPRPVGKIAVSHFHPHSNSVETGAQQRSRHSLAPGARS